MKLRKSARRMGIRKRFMAVTSQERLKANKYKLWFYVSIVKWSKTCGSAKSKLLLAAKWSYLKYLSVLVDTNPPLEPPRRLNRTIESFSESQCWNFFETRKEDLPRLYKELHFPDVCKLSNGGKLSGEEVFLRGLYELVSGEDQFSICENVFGRDQSYQSRAYKYFIDHIYYRFLDLLTDNLKWWKDNGFMEESRAAIQRKLEEVGMEYGDEEINRVGMFIDCNCMETSRVGGGPRGDGPDADRWHCNIQRAFYNGWKSIHGLKHQTVDLAHGFTIDMFGPTSLRRNDLQLLGRSMLHQRMTELFANEELKMLIYGDSIYPHLPHLMSSWRNGNNTPEQNLDNHCYKSVRIAIEWNYGVTANLFAYLKNLHKLRLMNNTVVVKIYTVATLLRNCHIALYGGISSSYFGIILRDNMLEKYLRQENFNT